MVLEYIFTLLMLIVLQAVLGIDNLLYISLESKKAPEEKQNFVRKIGIGIAIVLRIGLLFLIVSLVDYFAEPLFELNFTKIIEGKFNFHSLIVFVGGGFIIYTAIKEIWHMITFEKDNNISEQKNNSLISVITMIVIMNLVFSFDSILGAMALTKDIVAMIISIIISGVIMMWLSEIVSDFLHKNKKFEILGLFILFLIGIMLISEAGHLSHLKIFGNEITAMSKTTFYFILAIIIIIDVVQTKYQRNLLKKIKK